MIWNLKKIKLEMIFLKEKKKTIFEIGKKCLKPQFTFSFFHF